MKLWNNEAQYHTPVLLQEVMEYLHPCSGQTFIDCTLGGGGHAKEIMQRIEPDGRMLGIDADEDALHNIISKKGFIAVRGNFRDIEALAKENGFQGVHGILFDLGVSSFQLDNPQKGFGFFSERLDMRMDARNALTAHEIIKSWRREDLEKIFREYGEEKLAPHIARAIVQRRKQEEIHSPEKLASIISDVYKKYYRKPSRKNPATRVFQALRIAVNDELHSLSQGIYGAIGLLRSGGRIAVISYHSLEDGNVKEIFKKESRDCICNADIPACQCAHARQLRILTKKPIVPDKKEAGENPRARSAKLRVAEKI